LRHPKFSNVLSWILVITLTLSPLIAQSRQAAGISDALDSTGDNDSALGGQQVTTENHADPAVREDAAAHARVPLLMPTTAVGLPYPTTVPKSMPSRFPGSQSDGKAPGETKWVVLAILLAAGTGVALYYLLRGIGGGDSSGPVGTVISAGPPAVTNPAR
jgi:hypothetical protein